MFEDSLMESTRRLSKRRGWMMLLSSGLQVFVLAILVTLPLLRTDAITARYTPILPGPIMSPAPSQGRHPRAGTADSGRTTPIMQVRQDFTGVPFHVNTDPDPVGRPTPVCLANCGTLSPGDLVGPESVSRPVLAPQTPKGPPHISRLDPGQIVRRVEPIYPPLAKATRTQGAVTLHALIGRDGAIENLQLMSGHPLLVRAALDAVSQWRFRPYVLNGQPIEVETEITINFILER